MVISFLIGVVIGGSLGMLLMGLIAYGKRGDNDGM